MTVAADADRPDQVPPGAPASRPPLPRSMLVAVVLAYLPFLALVALPSGDLLRKEALGGFYDAQARALLHGHWNVDPDVVTIEGFSTPRGMQIYFGPVPAVMRMPIAAVTDHFDGRLTRPSMLLADALLLVALARLAAWLKLLLLPSRKAAERGDPWTALTVFALGTSLPVVIASWPWVYNEAIIWGAALATSAFWLLAAYLVQHRTRTLVGATALGVLAVLTRAAVGIGPLVAVVGVGLAELWVHRRARRSTTDRPEARPLRTLAVGLAGLAVAGGLYVGVNVARFGTPLRVPYEQQRSIVTRSRTAALAANGGGLTNAAYIPTQGLQAVRPDAIRFRKIFPFVAMPRGQAPLVVPATFESRAASNSLFTSAPVPFLLAVFGCVVVVAPRRRFGGLDPRRRALAPLVAGAAVGTLGVLTFADIAPRYLGDALPLLGVAGLIGTVALGAHLEAWRPRTRDDRWRRVALGAVAVLAAGGVWVNAAFATEIRFDQTLSLPFTELRRWSSLQLRVADALPGTYPPAWVGRKLVNPPSSGSLALLGDCQGLYRASDIGWTTIEGQPGVSEAVVTAPPRGREPSRVLVSKRDSIGSLALRIDAGAGDEARVVLHGEVQGKTVDATVVTTTWTAQRRPKLHLIWDHRTGEVRIIEGNDLVLGILTYVPVGPLQPGAGVEMTASPHRICPALHAALRHAGR